MREECVVCGLPAKWIDHDPATATVMRFCDRHATCGKRIGKEEFGCTLYESGRAADQDEDDMVYLPPRKSWEFVGVPKAEYERLKAELADLRALLREAAPKCSSCGVIATLHYVPGIACHRWSCDEHKGDIYYDEYNLGRRIKAALEGREMNEVEAAFRVGALEEEIERLKRQDEVSAAFRQATIERLTQRAEAAERELASLRCLVAELEARAYPLPLKQDERLRVELAAERERAAAWSLVVEMRSNYQRYWRFCGLLRNIIRDRLKAADVRWLCALDDLWMYVEPCDIVLAVSQAKGEA